MFGVWDVRDVGCSGCEMWNVRDVGCWDVGCSGCGMFEMWDVWDVGCGVFGMWDVGCEMFAGMWDVDLQNAYRPGIVTAQHEGVHRAPCGAKKSTDTSIV